MTMAPGRSCGWRSRAAPAEANKSQTQRAGSSAAHHDGRNWSTGLGRASSPGGRTATTRGVTVMTGWFRWSLAGTVRPYRHSVPFGRCTPTTRQDFSVAHPASDQPQVLLIVLGEDLLPVPRLPRRILLHGVDLVEPVPSRPVPPWRHVSTFCGVNPRQSSQPATGCGRLRLLVALPTPAGRAGRGAAPSVRSRCCL